MNFVKASTTRKTDDDDKESNNSLSYRQSFTEQDQISIAESAQKAFNQRKHGKLGLGAQHPPSKRPRWSQSPPASACASESSNRDRMVAAQSSKHDQEVKKQMTEAETVRQKRERLQQLSREQFQQADAEKKQRHGASNVVNADTEEPNVLGLADTEKDTRHAKAMFGCTATTRTQNITAHQARQHREDADEEETFDFDAVYSSHRKPERKNDTGKDIATPSYKIIEKNDRVKARWSVDGEWYDAIVQSVTHGGYENARYCVWFPDYKHHQANLPYTDVEFGSRPSEKLNELISSDNEPSPNAKVSEEPAQQPSSQKMVRKSNWRERLKQKQEQRQQQ